MADTQSILQLGIEAARSGDKAEARELFRLVTREDPNSAQGWLWLAGVAEDREEKRAALERVVQLDPSNDLARKGLAALGGARAAAAPVTPAPTPVEPVRPAPIAEPEEEAPYDPFVAAEPRQGGAQVYSQPEQVGGYVPPAFGDDDYDLSDYQRQPEAADPAAGDRDAYVMVEDEEPRRRGIGAFWPVLLILLLLLGALAYFLLGNRGGDNVATDPGASALASTAASDAALGDASATASSDATGLLESPAASADASAVAGGAEASAAPSGDAAASAPVDGVASPAPDAAASAPAASVDAAASAPAASVEPVASAPAASEAALPPPVADVATANPAIVGNDQLLRAGNLEFGFSGITNVATGSYGGAPPARGRYLIVLMTVRNVGDAPAQIPDGAFVVKDAQGRVSDFNRAASVDYINRFGVGPRGAGDYPADATLAPGALLGSVPLLFDVATDATDLVVFARDNQAQGFLVRGNSQ